MTNPQSLRHAMDTVLELHEMGELEQALARCEDVVERTAAVGSLDDPVVRESAFTARLERAQLLAELGDFEAAAEAYGQAATVAADVDDPDQRHEIAMAMLNRGICLTTLGANEQALAAYDELIVRFGTADDPVTRDQVIRGRVNRAAALLSIDRPHEAATAAGALLHELSPQDALDAEQFVLAVRIRAAAAHELDGPRAALGALTRLAQVLDEDPAVRVQLAMAQLEHAEHLLALGEQAKAAALLDALCDRYASDPDPAVAEALVAVQEGRLVLIGPSDPAAPSD